MKTTLSVLQRGFSGGFIFGAHFDEKVIHAAVFSKSAPTAMSSKEIGRITMRIILVLLALLPTLTANAAVLHVGQGVMAPYSDIQTAINAASPGDTITIAPSPYAYSGTVTVDRRLMIIGAGFDTTAGNHTLVEGIIQITAPGCIVRSLWQRGSRCSDSNYEFNAAIFLIGADSALVEDCCVENLSSGGYNCYCVSGLLVTLIQFRFLQSSVPFI